MAPFRKPHLVNVHHHHLFNTLVPEDLSGCGTLPACSSNDISLTHGRKASGLYGVNGSEQLLSTESRFPHSGSIRGWLLSTLRHATEPMPGSLQLRFKPGPTLNCCCL